MLDDPHDNNVVHARLESPTSIYLQIQIFRPIPGLRPSKFRYIFVLWMYATGGMMVHRRRSVAVAELSGCTGG